MSDFHPFSLVHAAVVLLFAAVIAAIVAGGARAVDVARRERIERAVGVVLLAAWIGLEGWWMWPTRFDVAYTLPIQVCDLLALALPFVFLSRRRFAKAIVYFWGLTLTLQGIVTPDLVAGPATLQFWLFWLMHMGIVGVAAYTIVVHRFRPTWRDWRTAVVAGLVYLAIILPVDLHFHWNYAFVNDTRPSQPSLIDLLGPWPERVFAMVALAAAAMAVLELPALAARRS
jgi:hypothetical integral membrane protein (TIGR02206 family)